MPPLDEMVFTPPASSAPSLLPPAAEYRYIDNETPAPTVAAAEPETAVDVAAFGARADGTDCTPAVRAALEHCRATGAHRLVFPKGRYVFHPDYAAEQYLFMSNNDSGLRRIAFLIENFSGLEIDGQGSEFLFHGRIVPFVVEHSSRVFIRNVSVDWDVPFHCEGKIIASDEAGMELEIPEQYPYKVANGRFQSLGPSAEGWTLYHLLEFDPARQETAYGAADYFGVQDKFRVEEAGPRRIRLRGPLASPLPRPGNVMLLSDSRRMYPAFFVTDTEGFTLADTSIFHAGAMGVIAQRSADLRLSRVNVLPRPDSGRVISTTADATHFVSCRGRIELSDCVFRTQVDDATNVHGIYSKITGQPDDRTVTVRLVHPQQAGTGPIQAGHRLRFISHQTLLPVHEATVVTARRLNDEYTAIEFAEPLPGIIRVDDAVLDLYWQPAETIIRRCTATGNRARGFLLSVGGRIVVEDCRFHTPGAAILIEGDANYWFESGPVSDVTITRNDFDNCNYGPWGRAAIQISPGIKSPFHQEPRYHHNVRIEHNRFEVFFPTLLDAQDTDGLLFRDNQVTPSDAYPPKQPAAPPFVIENCSNVQADR